MKHPVDISAAAGFIAAGGLAGAAAFFAVVDQQHAPIYNAAAVGLASLAGLIRVLYNPTPPTGTQAALLPDPAPAKPKAADLTAAAQDPPKP